MTLNLYFYTLSERNSAVLCSILSDFILKLRSDVTSIIALGLLERPIKNDDTNANENFSLKKKGYGFTTVSEIPRQRKQDVTESWNRCSWYVGYT